MPSSNYHFSRPGLILCLALLSYSIGNAQEKDILLYRDSTADIAVRIADLLSRMTLEEKVKQLDMYSAGDLCYDGRLSVALAKQSLNGSSIGCVHDFYPETAEYANELQRYIIENTRLGIPALFIEEALHGYQGNQATAFPVPIGLGSMWDTELMERIGKAVGSEARSVGVHMVLAPVLGIGREPRWGRVQETYGEDPYLAARSGVGYINGLQGDDLAHDDAVVAEPKHFGVQSIPAGGKNTAPVYIGEREARSNFLYVFEKAFVEAEALGAMAAYHEWDGIPAAADHWLLTELLREEWGFKGMVLSDLGAIAKQTNAHGTAASPKEAITNSISAGLDMQFYDYAHDVFQQSVIEAVKDKSLKMEDVDRAVASILYVKFRLGLFENPYTKAHLQQERYHSKKHQDLALEAARKSIVLLQNEGNILPLGNEVKKIAVIGEMAGKVHLGGYSPKNVVGTSIVDALKETDYEVDFVDLNIPAFNMEQISDKFLRTEDGRTGLLAEYFNNPYCEGKPAFSQVERTLVKYWHNLSPEAGVTSDSFSVRYSGFIVPELSGTYKFGLIADDIARLAINEELLIDNWDRSTINQWAHKAIRLEKGQKYAIKLEFAEFTDYAGVQLKWEVKPDLDNQINMYDHAVAAAKDADIALLVLGETEDDSGEGKDKMSLHLNENGKRLLNEVAKSGTPIILILQNGRPMVLTEELDKVDAILETWYAGELGGQATVDILTGKVNPSGKLPISFPRHDGQLPIFYNHKKSTTGSFVDGTNKPLFAFGFGMNYSTFQYTDLSIEKSTISTTENQTISVKVKNVSDRAGTEIVQLYITDTFSSVATPVMQLRGFKRVELKPQEEKTITFTVLPDDLALWNRAMKRVVEPGEFLVKVGAASNDIRLESAFEVK